MNIWVRYFKMIEYFSVVQFFEDKSYEYVRRHIDVESAIKVFQHYISSVSAKMGITARVIITDDGDCIVAEWIYEKGLVYPPKTQRAKG